METADTVRLIHLIWAVRNYRVITGNQSMYLVNQFIESTTWRAYVF